MDYARGEAAGWSVLVEHLEQYLDLSSARVLDIGCGSGGVSQALSQRCELLATTDIRANSVRNGVEKSACERTIGCQIDAATPPFKDDQFDLVLLNGVLEWVPLASDDDPTERQLQTLREVNRVLAPGGYLYLGIETRYYAPYWVGVTEHDGLPFDQILPRRLADAYYGIVRGRPLKTYLHTVDGYRRLLDRAGFGEVSVASALPTYKAPQRIIPLEDMAQIRRTVSEIDEPRWRRPFRRLLATNRSLFELLGTEVGIMAQSRSSSNR